MNVSCYILQVSGGEDEIQQLQKALLDYLDENTETDASLLVNFNFLDVFGLYKWNFINGMVYSPRLLDRHTFALVTSSF